MTDRFGQIFFRAQFLLDLIDFYTILKVRDPILPGPKAFGRGPGKIRASDL
jgi:hypothetical protein